MVVASISLALNSEVASLVVVHFEVFLNKK